MGTNLSFKGWRSRTPLVIDATDPYAVGVCDGCGFWVNHKSLLRHLVYRGGTVPVWDGLLFCSKCDDVPNPAPQFSRLTLFPDPVPVENPRVEPTINSGYGYWVDNNGNYVNLVADDDTWGGEFVVTITPTRY